MTLNKSCDHIVIIVFFSFLLINLCIMTYKFEMNKLNDILY